MCCIQGVGMFCRHGRRWADSNGMHPERVDYERTIETPRMAADSHVRLALGWSGFSDGGREGCAGGSGGSRFLY